MRFSRVNSLAAEGAQVVVNDIDVAAGEQTVSDIGPSATFVRGDVSQDASTREVFDAVRSTHGRLDISVHNAGIMDPRDEGVTETPLEVWDKVIAVNLTGVFLSCRYAVPLMLDTPGTSSLINIASFVALMGAAAPQIAYTASKGGVLAMTREIAVQYAPTFYTYTHEKCVIVDGKTAWIMSARSRSMPRKHPSERWEAERCDRGRGRLRFVMHRATHRCRRVYGGEGRAVK